MKNKVFVIIMASAIFLGSLGGIFARDRLMSDSERRLLQQLPELSFGNLFSGDFMEDFESYAQDQFPLRDPFRGIKSFVSLRLLGQLDNNGLYIAHEHISKLDGPINEDMLSYAAERMKSIYERYLEGTDCKVFFSLIPDKNYFIAPHHGRPYLDFKQLEEYMLSKTEYMEYIPIAEYLDESDYYYSDSHWRQERIEDVAAAVCAAMDAQPLSLQEYDIRTLSEPFRGVYSVQLALSGISDRLYYAENETIRGCTVTSYDSGKAEPVDFYDMDAAMGRDPYEMFLNGADALLVIDNPSAKEDRELVIFRDSFGSSLSPLLIESYRRITLVDTRYINSMLLKNFIDFDEQDVLFIYSSSLINNSLAMK